jgi:protein-S-isoprenylcysteine O-methyltransferase Ste14
MSISGEIIGLCWFVFFFVWFVASLRGGASTRSSSATAGAIRLLVFVVLVIAFRSRVGVPPPGFGALSPELALVGDVLCIAGLAFAVWARLALGRNWGMPMTLHEQPDLVTSGPYRFVRHPIYTGVSAMFVGTAFVFPIGVIGGILTILYLVFSALREERDMERRFGDAYSQYRRGSKMLLPFVL